MGPLNPNVTAAVDPCPHMCVRCGGCPECCPCDMGDLLTDALLSLGEAGDQPR